MPHFYFDVHDGVDLVDDFGLELADLATAEQEALRLAAGLLADNPHHFHSEPELEIEIRTGAGRRLASLRLRAEFVRGDPWSQPPDHFHEGGAPCVTS